MASSLKRWNEIGGGDLQKWDEKGKSLEGKWQGTKPGKFGDLGIIETADGHRINFPMHTVLISKMAQIKTGAEVRIEYLGKATGKTGTEYKDFFVGVESMDDIKSSAAGGDSEPDDDVPF